MPMSDLLDQRVLNWAFAATAFPVAPAAVYVALFTTSPTKASGGTEVSGSGYARVQASPSDWNVSGPTYKVENVSVLKFPVATGSWGTVVGFGLYDAATGGNLLYVDDLTSPITVGADDPVVFNLAQLTVTGVV